MEGRGCGEAVGKRFGERVAETETESESKLGGVCLHPSFPSGSLAVFKFPFTDFNRSCSSKTQYGFRYLETCVAAPPLRNHRSPA